MENNSSKWFIAEYNEWIEDGRPINQIVTSLEIYNSNITSLVGLGNLPNLTQLRCDNNQITSLNGVESLTNLIYIRCINNNISSLLELKNLNKLSRLECGDNNISSLVGLENLINLTNISCEHNNITTLCSLKKLTNLINLLCCYNQITSLECLINLTNLTSLYCRHNKITSLHGLENITKLETLSCQNNEITSFDGLGTGFVASLTQVFCDDNQITSFDGLKNHKNLTDIWCSNNKIVSLNDLNNLNNLRILYIHHNEIISLDGVENLIKLNGLDCCYNQITSLNGIENLRQLINIQYNNNPIYHIPPNIIRIIDGMHCGKKLYQDAENVHDHSIQDSIRKSVIKIMAIKPVITDTINYILQDKILTDETKEIILEYNSNKNIYSVLDITFGELLMYVINRIEINEHKDEIKNILNVVMKESICKCFTGRISRLVNCLVGFDPLVTIQITDNEQIANVISTISQSLNNKNTYTVELHKNMVKKQLEELRYSSPVIEEWIMNIE